MTAQVSDRLINHYKFKFKFKTWNLRLYKIVTGTISETELKVSLYNHKINPLKLKPVMSSNWKGYIPTYELTKEGFLILKDFGEATPENFQEEKLEGDFYMVLKEGFFSPGIFVPFENSIINSDPDSWYQTEEGPDPLGKSTWSGKLYTKNIIKQGKT